MIAVIFEVEPAEGQREAYLEEAARLRPLLESHEGFVSIERYQSLTDPARILSLSFFTDEEAVRHWRMAAAHRSVQQRGREAIFTDYRLRVAQVMRDYGMFDRGQAPQDSKAFHAAAPLPAGGPGKREGRG